LSIYLALAYKTGAKKKEPAGARYIGMVVACSRRGLFPLPHYHTITQDLAIVTLRKHYGIAQAVSFFRESKAIKVVDDSIHFLISFFC
jgi:hypothetical protein